MALKPSISELIFKALYSIYGDMLPPLTLSGVMDINYSHLLQTKHMWLSPINLHYYADAIHGKGTALPNCWTGALLMVL